MSAPERTYSLSIKGRQHLYVVEAWQALTFEQLVDTLSDLTDYLPEHLAKTLPERFDRLGYAWIASAQDSFGGPPVFAIRSGDGGKP